MTMHRTLHILDLEAYSTDVTLNGDISPLHTYKTQ